MKIKAIRVSHKPRNRFMNNSSSGNYSSQVGVVNQNQNTQDFPYTVIDSISPEGESDKNIYSAYRSMLENEKIKNEINKKLEDDYTSTTELEEIYLSKEDASKDYLSKEDASEEYLSKSKGGVIEKPIELMEGLSCGDAKIENKDGKSHMILNSLNVIGKASFNTLNIIQTQSSKGSRILSDANIKISKVEELLEKSRLYFKNTIGDETIMNDFCIGDFAFMQTFNESTGTRFYWGEVVGCDCDFIEVSNTNIATGSSIPKIDDVVIQLGNKSDKTRQNAIVENASNGQIYYKVYIGIDSFTLEGKDKFNYGIKNGIPYFYLGKENDDDFLLFDESGLRIKSKDFQVRSTDFKIIDENGNATAVFTPDGKLVNSAINTDILTAKQVQTASTGKRVEINTSGLRSFNSDNNVSMEVIGDKFSTRADSFATTGGYSLPIFLKTVTVGFKDYYTIIPNTSINVRDRLALTGDIEITGNNTVVSFSSVSLAAILQTDNNTLCNGKFQFMAEIYIDNSCVSNAYSAIYTLEDASIRTITSTTRPFKVTGIGKHKIDVYLSYTHKSIDDYESNINLTFGFNPLPTVTTIQNLDKTTISSNGFTIAQTEKRYVSVIKTDVDSIFQTRDGDYILDVSSSGIKASNDGGTSYGEVPFILSSGSSVSATNNGYCGYRKWSNGVLECWGVTSDIAQDTSKVIYFPTSVKFVGNYTVTSVVNSKPKTVNQYTNGHYISSKTASNFTITLQDYGAEYGWQAIGRWK